MKIDQLVIREPVTVAPDVTIQRAALRMAEHGVGSLVVTDGERVVGIVTDRDLVVRAIARRVPVDGRIDAVMTTDVVTVDSDADIRDVTRAFGQHAVRRLPVTTEGRLTGLVSLDDLLTSFVGQFTELTNGLTAQLLFPHGHDEPPVPATRAASSQAEDR
jgi:CBS domain-containing protein